MSPVGSQATACVEHKISTESPSYIRKQLTFKSSIYLILFKPFILYEESARTDLLEHEVWFYT